MRIVEKYTKCLICDSPMIQDKDASTPEVDGMCPNGCTQVEFMEATLNVCIYVELDLLEKHYPDHYDDMIGGLDEKKGFFFYADYFGPDSGQSDWPKIKQEEGKLEHAVRLIREKRETVKGEKKMIQTREDINKLSPNQQLEFYKKQFLYQHCACNCGREIGTGGSWVVYEGDVFQRDCFDYLRRQEKERIEKHMERLQEELEKEKRKYEQFDQ